MQPQLSRTGKRWLIDDVDFSGTDIARLLAEKRGIDLSIAAHAPSPQSPQGLGDTVGIFRRIRRAAENRERVLILGDYDCDGITATVLMARLLRRHGIEPSIRLPHRVNDGYGLTPNLADEICKTDTALLITVDSGISSHDEVALLQAKGIDVIITDHHALPQKLPPAFAIAHPELSNSYARPHPSGAGVVLQIIRAIEGENGPTEAFDLELAMLGTIADVMELKGDNRAIVAKGLAALAHDTDSPIARLCAAANVDTKTATATDIAFRIAPRINAAGRMDDPLIALRALEGDRESLDALNELNERRRDETDQCLLLALEDMRRATAASAPLIASLHERYGHGVIGLVAGKLTERSGMPSLIATCSDDICTASLRSPPCVDITAALRECHDLLDRYGGHAQAAGCSFRKDRFDPIVERLSRTIADRTDANDLRPHLHMEGRIDLHDVSLRSCDALRALEPFGAGNPEPRFLLKDVTLDSASRIGGKGEHLRCKIGSCSAVGFGLGEYAQSEPRADIACRIAKNTWMGKTSAQIIIEDIRDVR